MRCKEVRRIFRKWLLSSKNSFPKKFMAKLELAVSHAVDCDKCRKCYYELADERDKRGLNGPNDEHYR